MEAVCAQPSLIACECLKFLLDLLLLPVVVLEAVVVAAAVVAVVVLVMVHGLLYLQV